MNAETLRELLAAEGRTTAAPPPARFPFGWKGLVVACVLAAVALVTVIELASAGFAAGMLVFAVTGAIAVRGKSPARGLAVGAALACGMRPCVEATIAFAAAAWIVAAIDSLALRG